MCRKLTVPTQLIYGDWDAVRTSHAAKFFELLGGGLQDALWDGSGMNANRLAILPGVTHYTMMTEPKLAETALALYRSGVARRLRAACTPTPALPARGGPASECGTIQPNAPATSP